MKFILVFVLATTTLFFQSCSKETGNTGPKENIEEESNAKAGTTESETITQKMCPVSNEAINENIYTEYNGEKVYFCCKDCKDSFLKDPQKYMKKDAETEGATESQDHSHDDHDGHTP